jgi:hypothetical protein
MKDLKTIRSLIDSKRRWKIYLLLGVTGYFILINQILRVRPDHIFFALFLFSFVLGKGKAKRFISDWLPFVGFWILYDMMRGVVDGWRLTGHIRDVYNAEFFLFGKMFQNLIPSFWFQQMQLNYDGSFWKAAMDIIAANLYAFHFALPLLLGWIIWHTCNDRIMYYRYVWTITILNVMALITFFVFPAAGPWYVMQYGFDQPTGHLLGTAGSLVNFDNIVKMKFFTTLWNNFSPNQFAAIPSLHAGYPVVLSIFAFLKFRKYAILIFTYPVLVWWAAVYLNLHYVVDILATLPYILIAYMISNKILIPKLFGPWFLDEQPYTFEHRIEKTVTE